MTKETRTAPTPQKTVKKIMWSGITSFILVLIFPKSFKYFMQHWFAGIAKNIVYIVLTGLLTQKLVNWILQDDSFSK